MSRSPYVIVIADDDSLINELLAELLSDEGYSVLCCFSGEDAERVITRVIPNLVILDMQMEQHDSGIHVLRSLRENPATKAISVIVCSADGAALHANEAHLKSFGAEFLTKPFDVEHLLDLVRRMLARARMDASSPDNDLPDELDAREAVRG